MGRHFFSWLFLTPLAVLPLSLATTALAQNVGLPDALREVYKSWVFSCQEMAKDDNASKKFCQISQVLTDNSSGRLVFSLTLRKNESGDVLTGTIVAPFGLELKKGLMLYTDDANKGVSASFSTCYPRGCFAPLELDEKLIAQMRAGAKLRAEMTAMENGKPVNIELSLEGFSAAHDRLKNLSAY